MAEREAVNCRSMRLRITPRLILLLGSLSATPVGIWLLARSLWVQGGLEPVRPSPGSSQVERTDSTATREGVTSYRSDVTLPAPSSRVDVAPLTRDTSHLPESVQAALLETGESPEEYDRFQEECVRASEYMATSPSCSLRHLFYDLGKGEPGRLAGAVVLPRRAAGLSISDEQRTSIASTLKRLLDEYKWKNISLKKRYGLWSPPADDLYSTSTDRLKLRVESLKEFDEYVTGILPAYERELQATLDPAADGAPYFVLPSEEEQ